MTDPIVSPDPAPANPSAPILRVVQFSGGKDSTALVLWAKEQPWPDGFATVFCDTGWEHPATYAYVDYINRTQLGGALVTLRSEKYPNGMRDLVAGKKRPPSTRARFCTEELKVKPFAAWLWQQEYSDCIVYQGIRGAESASRLAAGPRMWNDLFDAWVERPLFDWSADDVFAAHKRHGVAPNPLYQRGASRVGCFPCIMLNHGELRRMSHSAPEIWDRAAELEAITGRSFFHRGYIPDRFCSQIDPKSGEPFPLVADVRAYLLDANAKQLRMWDREPPTACMSVYNLCE